MEVIHKSDAIFVDFVMFVDLVICCGFFYLSNQMITLLPNFMFVIL